MFVSSETTFELACPANSESQTVRLGADIHHACADSILGIYLHGSLAWGFQSSTECYRSPGKHPAERDCPEQPAARF